MTDFIRDIPMASELKNLKKFSDMIHIAHWTRLISITLIFSVIISCKNNVKTEAAKRISADRTDPGDTKVSGSIYLADATSQTSTVKDATVKIYKLDQETLAPSLVGTTTSADAGAYIQNINLGTSVSTLLVTALDGATPIGQTIVGASALSGTTKTRSLKADVTKASTIAASLLLSKKTNLQNLDQTAITKITTSVQTEVDKQPSSSTSTIFQNLAASTTFVASMSSILSDSGIKEARSGAAVSNVSSLIPTIATLTTITLSSIEIEATASQVAKGLDITAKAYGVYSDATRTDITTSVSWSSSSNTLATVAVSGRNAVIHGVAAGSVTISASFSGKSSDKAITVTAAQLVSLDITPKSLTLASATNQQFTATGTFTDNSTQDVTSTVVWASTATGVATVSDTAGTKGLALTVAGGAGTITATSGSVSAQVTFTVSSATLTSIQITPATPSVANGLSADLVATGTYSDSSTHDITTSVTWSSDTPGVATISNTTGTKGRVTGVSVGTATISAVLSSITGTISVQVTAAELSSIQLTPASASLAKGTTTDIVATGIYTDSTNQDITALATWAAVDTSVATVTTSGTPRGRVTAVNIGSTNVSASYSSKSTSAAITVTAATLTSIAVTPATPTSILGQSRQFTATGTYSDNSTQDITTSVTWTSGTPAHATISNAGGSKGLASTVAVGTSTITATLGAVSGNTVFTVSAATLVSIAVTPATPTIAKGLTQQFVATGTYNDSSTQVITSSVTWTSSDTAVSTISNAGGSQGLATGLDVGNATITATSGAVSGTAALTVSSAELVSIAITPGSPSKAKGLTQQFTATGTYTDSTTSDLTTQVTWQSATPAVATISNVNGSRGLATTVAVGTSDISAALNTVNSQITFTVTAATLASIAVSPATPSVAKGLTQQFTATGTYTDSSTQDVTSSATWTSSSTSQATINSNGLATMVDTGSSTITATMGAVSGTSALTVAAPTLVSLAVTPTTPSITYGGTQQFTATGTYPDTSTANITNSVTWTSSNTGKATVNSSTGLATSAGVGTSTITATLGAVANNTVLTVNGQAAPTELTGLSGTVDSTQQITLNWTTGGGTTASYVIAYQTGSNPANCTTGSTTTASSTTKAISGLASNTQYYFRVCAANGNPTPDLSTGVTTSQTTAPALSSIAVTPATPSVAKGLTQQFTATGTYENASTADLTSTVTWTSSDTGKATINSTTGLATTVAVGTSTITATLGAVSGTTVLTVGAATLVSLAVTPATPSITYGGTQQFTATGTYTDATTANITGTSTWTSSNTANATINSSTGLATSAGIGTSTITATLGADTNNTVLTVNGQAAPTELTGLSGTVDSSSQITLNWTSGGGTTAGYLIAYQSGASAPSDCVSGTTTTSATNSKVIESLAASTQYSFRVCAINGNPTPDASTGVTTSATTTAAGSITITANNGGVNWIVTNSQTITWTSSGVTGNVKIELSKNSGSTWINLVTTGNTGTYSTTGLCAKLGYSNLTTARIRITSVDTPSIFDISDSDFSTSNNPNCP